MENVWIVGYFDECDSKPTVTAFSNQQAAIKCYKYFFRIHKYVFIDKCPVYKNFITYQD